MKLTKLILAALAAAVLAPAANAATFTTGDLLLAFRSTTDSNTFVLNLGDATAYRDNFNGAFVSTFGLATIDISAPLIAAFGTDWNASTTFMGVASVNSTAGSGNSSGEPSRTFYLGAESLPDDPSNAWTGSSSGTATGGTGISSFQTGFQNATATYFSGRGAVIPNTAINTWDEFNDGTTSFNIFGTTNNNGVESNLVVGGMTQNDVYRLQTTGTGITGAAGSVQTSTFEGSLLLDSTGNLTTAAVPEPSTYGLMALGALGLLGAVRRRLTAKA